MVGSSASNQDGVILTRFTHLLKQPKLQMKYVEWQFKGHWKSNNKVQVPLRDQGPVWAYCKPCNCPDFPSCSQGWRHRWNLEDSPSWGDGASKSLWKIRWPEFTEQSTKSRELHKERNPEICRRSAFHLGTDKNLHVRKLIKFRDRTIGIDYREHYSELMQGLEQFLFLQADMENLIIHKL